MSPLMKSNNLAARMGRWSASHWKTAVFGWIAFVLLAVVAGNMIGTKQIDQRDTNTGQARQADQILKQAGFEADPQTEIVLVQSKSSTIDDAAFRATVADVTATVKPFAAEYKNFRSPLGHADQVTADGRTAMVEFDMRGTQKQAEKRIDGITTATGKIQARHPGFFVGEAGSISSGKALNDAFNSQLAKAGERSVPLTLLILLIVFGALVAAGIPLLLALSAVIATLGLISIPSHLVPMDPNVSAVVLLVGLAVGVDYSLFYLKREREERAAGMGPRAALEAAAATSGRSVLISGLTVMVAMAGLLFAQDRTYLSFGVATMTVVAVAMIGSLTVLPALLSRLGDKVEKGKVPFLHRLRREGGENRFWSAILDPVLRHPVVSVVASAGALIVLALPVLHIHTSQTGLDALPKSIATVPTIDRIQQAFPGGADPGARRDPGSRGLAGREGRRDPLESEALATGVMTGPISVDVSADRGTTRVAIPFKGNGTDGTSLQALHELRDVVLPATIGALPNATYAVTGPTAASADENSLLKHSRAARVRVRADAGVRPAARLVPLDRDRGEGDRPQPAVGRGRLRRPRDHLPVGLGRVAPELPLQRGHRILAPDLPLRDPVRALDGLPRVHPEPDPRGVRPRHEDRGRGRSRHQDHGGRRHQCRGGDGRGVLDLRDAPDPRHEGARHRAGRGRPDRRHDRPGRPPPGRHEAARRLELVPAELARLAASPRPRRRSRLRHPDSGDRIDEERTSAARQAGAAARRLRPLTTPA